MGFFVFCGVFCFFLVWPVGVWFPDQGSNPCPLQWKRRVLTAGPPGESQGDGFLIPCHFPLATHQAEWAPVERKLSSKDQLPCLLHPLGSLLWPPPVPTAAIAALCHGCLSSSQRHPGHLCCLSLLMPSPPPTVATIGGGIKITRMPSKCLTPCARNGYIQPGRPMRSGGHEGGGSIGKSVGRARRQCWGDVCGC